MAATPNSKRERKSADAFSSRLRKLECMAARRRGSRHPQACPKRAAALPPVMSSSPLVQYPLGGTFCPFLPLSPARKLSSTREREGVSCVCVVLSSSSRESLHMVTCDSTYRSTSPCPRPEVGGGWGGPACPCTNRARDHRCKFWTRRLHNRRAKKLVAHPPRHLRLQRAALPAAMATGAAALVCLMGVLLLVGVGAVDFNYPAVFNFGDSNSDTGDLIAGLGQRLEPPNGQTHFRTPSGRFCDGRLIIDFLMDAMDLPLLNPYLDSLGAPIFQKGCNFAAAGSTILPATASSVSPFSFGIQVAQFSRFRSRVLELQAKGKKWKKYIPQEMYFSQGLYMFDIGQNDLAGAFYSKSEDQVIASIPTILVEFETGIKKLYDLGARRFWIHNTGPLGCLAQNIAVFGKDPSKLDDLGCVLSHIRAAKLFNLQLHALSTKLQGQFTDANVTYVDVFSIKQNLIANYSRYGFEHPIMACCGVGGPPLNYDSRLLCGETKILNGTAVTATGCNDTSAHINWDGIHYTEAANLHVSSQILTGRYSDPPFSESMPFLLKLKF